MRVLVICRYFPPENRIGAIRPSRFARYLDQYDGTEVDALTVSPLGADKTEQTDDYRGVKVMRAAPSAFVSRINGLLKRGDNDKPASADAGAPSQVKKSTSGTFKQKIRKVLYNVRERMLDASYLRGAKKILKKQSAVYDVVFSSYSTEFGHEIGLWYKKKHPAVKWITDYRDALWGADSTQKQIKKGSAFVRRMSEKCDAVTVVSKSIVDIHKDDFKNKPVYVIPNGYDAEDTVISDNINKDGALTVVYTGELYNGKRDLTPLFSAITGLQNVQKLDLHDLKIIYAGKSGSVFESQISPYPGIEYENLGFIPRQDALKLQAEADMLLLASWCEPNEKSIITGKFFEYLQMRKPIVCIISGSASGSELTEMINGHRLGISCEAARKETDQKALCGYIERQLSCKKEHGRVNFTPDEEFIDRFDYKNITSMLYEVITQLK